VARWLLVVHRSSETSTNQSDVIIRSDDRFLNLVNQIIYLQTTIFSFVNINLEQSKRSFSICVTPDIKWTILGSSGMKFKMAATASGVPIIGNID
jgi:hypothetical protein